MSDNGSWIPYTFDGCDDALLWDDYMNKKPGYDSLLVALGGEPVIVEPGVLSPYGGTPMSIPGTIEVERYDEGGLGTAYGDGTSGNEGGNFRNDDVDIAGTGDQGGGYVLAWNDAGEWLKYTVNVTEGAIYDITYRVASPIGGGDFDLILDGELIDPGVQIGITGADWEAYTDVIGESVYLEAGEHILQIEFSSGGFNFNNIVFTKNTVLSGTQNVDGSSLFVYPNPVNEILHINSTNQILELVLTDMLGNQILVKETNGEIELSSLRKGLYHLQIVTDSQEKSIKFTKQ